jgi:hypothetical protein
MRRLLLLLFVVGLAVANSFAQAPPPSQVELNGFVLAQYAEAADQTFGTPYQVINKDNQTAAKVYLFDKGHNAYMVFEVPPDYEDRVFAIQITGEPGTSMRPFLGLVLGDSKEKVLQVLGKPREITPVEEWNADLYRYKERNYTVEISRDGKLWSIRIEGYDGLTDNPTLPKIDDFRKLIVNRDVDGLLQAIAGDLVIYRGHETFLYTAAARSELQDPNSAVHKLLFGRARSVRAAFTQEKFEPDMQIRVYENHSPAIVFKFEKSRILKEIVFARAPGAYMVWEIKLR